MGPSSEAGAAAHDAAALAVTRSADQEKSGGEPECHHPQIPRRLEA
jgi:hypothetical protein